MPNERHLIDYSTALNYINEFIRQYPQIASVSDGGFLDKASIDTIFVDTSTEEKGILFWQCYNQFNQMMPYYFAAFADKNNYNTNEPNINPDSDAIYFRNTYVHKFTEELNPANLNAYLTNPNTDINSLCTFIDLPTLLLFNDQFENEFPQSESGNYFNTNRYAFFIENAIGIKDILERSNRDVAGMNYYFGVDTIKGRICLVLFAVDRNGANILNNEDGSSAIILERSYP